MKTIALLLCLAFSTVSVGQNLTYKAANPNFGGDTFNYPWLLSSAQAQNDYKEENTNGYKQQTDLERFKSNLNNQLLNRLANSLFDSQFGNGTDIGTGTGTGTGNGILSPGTYLFGSLSIDIYHSNLGLVVDVLDTDTGEQTQVILPGQ
ncbi:curli assembly protein CsgF [Flavobacterium ginsengiterrae]|uniref:Curli production assembly/transport component CsgF n=1 Tax=Flavobacterium ginsengiterrae TaxID=871695 RepID=A0ABP7GMU5_9FLAO